jgi:lysophospholipase L1-like esterase
MKTLFLTTLCAAALMAAPALAQVQPTYIPGPPRLAPDQLPAVVDAAKRAATKHIEPDKIILVGDSTTQVGSGWGGAFCDNHVTSFLSCVNLARGGRGTFDYRAEGSWDISLGEMKVPGYRHVYVLIQFGHNDQPGKPGRTTDLYSEYPANLARYVTEARAAGAIPVLVTPLTRRSFKDGSLQADLNAWAEAVRKVAADMNVPLVDLNKVSTDAVQAMGPVAAISLSETPPPQFVVDAAKTGTTVGAPKNGKPAPEMANETLDTPQGHPTVVFDYTHLGPKGAEYFAHMVTVQLAKAVPDLRHELVDKLYPTPYDMPAGY